MGKRMSTKYKPILEEDLHKHVRNSIEAIMAQCGNAGLTGFRVEVPYGVVIEWEEKPTFSNLHWTKITFYGYTRFEQAIAHYEGKYGVWEIDLAGWHGYFESEEVAKRKPCIRTWGKARCITPSDEWHETDEQRKERIRKWIEEGVL